MSHLDIPTLAEELVIPTRDSLNVSLTPELVGFITAQVQSRRHHTASEVVRAGLRLLECADPVPLSKSRRRDKPRPSGATDARAQLQSERGDAR